MEKKNIRFGDLVWNSGRPETHALWMDPKQDRSLHRAIKENRVFTVIQEPTSKHKDYGRIGFHQEPHASYLIFPRPLPQKKDARVIGINYQLIEEPEVAVEQRAKPAKTRDPPA
jgi:hypothetical protein